MNDTREAVADLLDISKDYVSADFIREHMAEIGEAAQGSAAAIDQLKAELSEKVIAQIMVENGITEADQADILASVEMLQASIPDI
jgi:predicted transcriptional regulator